MATTSNVTPIRKVVAGAAADAECDMAWFNAMTESQRLAALRAAGTDCAAVAWAHWKQSTYCEEENAHG